MSDLIHTLTRMARETREFTTGARKDGFDAADALKALEDVAATCEETIRTVTRSAPLAVVAILTQERLCEEAVDIAKRCIDQVTMHDEDALAIRAKLQTFVDRTAEPYDKAEAKAREDALDVIREIDARYPPSIRAAA